MAFVLFGLLSAIQQALVGGVDVAGADRLIVRHKVSIIQLLPESYKARMERIPGVALATHQTWFGGIYQDPKNFFMQNPVVPEEFLDMHPEIILAPEQKKAWLATRTGRDRGPAKRRSNFIGKSATRCPSGPPIWRNKRRQPAPGSLTSWASMTARTRRRTRRRCFSVMIILTKAAARLASKGQVGWYTIRDEGSVPGGGNGQAGGRGI